MPTQPVAGDCINIPVLKSVKIHRAGPKIRGTRHHLASGVEDRELSLQKAGDVGRAMRLCTRISPVSVSHPGDGAVPGPAVLPCVRPHQ